MKRTGIITMGAKPYHIGHEHLINTASKNCDSVNCYVGTKPRGSITLEVMKPFWEKNIKQSLPENVTVHFVDNPVHAMMNFLNERNSLCVMTKYVLFGDPLDALQIISDEAIMKYWPFIHQNNLVDRVGIDRSETGGAHSSFMRHAVITGDYERFKKYVPACINPEEYWTTMRSTVKQDVLLIKKR